MITLKAKLKLLTGLHIGGGDDTMKIGGVDSQVLKREVFCNESGEISFPQYNKTSKELENGFRKINEPYIAGSSLKGKIRSLLEHHYGLVTANSDGKVITSKSNVKDVTKRDLIVKLFGEPSEHKNGKDKTNIEITRLVFRDTFITSEVRKAYLDGKVKLTEEKFENVIDRITGTTINGGLRQIERVVSGIEFDFDISIRTFAGDNAEEFKTILKLGLKLLEADALGGSGSRGYGKVKFIYADSDFSEIN